MKIVFFFSDPHDINRKVSCGPDTVYLKTRSNAFVNTFLAFIIYVLEEQQNLLLSFNTIISIYFIGKTRHLKKDFYLLSLITRMLDTLNHHRALQHIYIDNNVCTHTHTQLNSFLHGFHIKKIISPLFPCEKIVQKPKIQSIKI